MIDSYPLLSNMQFFFSRQNDSETPKSQTLLIPPLPCPMSSFFFRDKMTVNHQRAKHSQFLPFPVQCPLFSGQNDRETPKSQTWPIPTLPCPMSIESNTGNHKTHDSYHLLLDVLFHLLFGWKMYVTFAHLAEPPGLDLGHGQHPSRGWLHKADKGQTGSHTWREHVFVQLSKKKNDECVNKRTLKKMETTSKRDKGYLSLYAFCHSQKRGLYPLLLSPLLFTCIQLKSETTLLHSDAETATTKSPKGSQKYCFT